MTCALQYARPWVYFTDVVTSAFVGLATIVVLLPGPGKVSSLIHDTEVERMKRVSLCGHVLEQAY